jgi:predicted secreted protein
MSPIFAVAVYFVIWWTVLFVTLPFAGQSQQEAGTRVPGTPASAPAAPKFLRVIVATSVLAAILLGLVFLAIQYNLLEHLGYPVRVPADAPAGN